ncbi:unnamed protein product, partial [Rotaria sp. Silwood1]
ILIILFVFNSWAEEERSDTNFSNIGEDNSDHEDCPRRTTSNNYSFLSSSNLNESGTIYCGKSP